MPIAMVPTVQACPTVVVDAGLTALPPYVIIRDVGRTLRASVVGFALLMVVASPLAVCAVQAMAASVAQPMAACHDDMSRPLTLDCCARSTDGQPQAVAAKPELIQRHNFQAVLLEHPADSQHVIPSIASNALTGPMVPADTGPPDCIQFAVLLI